VSRIWVTDDTDTIRVEVFLDEEEGNASAECRTCPWTTDPDRVDQARDVIEEAGIHIHVVHTGGRS
jgi:hypothetical protein